MPLPVKRCPATYEANRESVITHTAEVLPGVLDRMEWGRNELILDHGSASGSSTLKYFAPIADATSSTVYALDICGSMTVYAAANNPHPRIKYVHGTLTQNPSPVDGIKFNKIFSLYTLHKIEDYRKELKALHNALAENGEMFMIICIYTHIFELYKEMKKHAKFGDHANDHLVVPVWLDEAELARVDPSKVVSNAIVATGFQILDSFATEKTHVFKNPRIFADMMFAMNPFAKHQDKDDHSEAEEMYRKFIRETETKLHKPTSDAANREYTLHYDALFIHVKKQ